MFNSHWPNPAKAPPLLARLSLLRVAALLAFVLPCARAGCNEQWAVNYNATDADADNCHGPPTSLAFVVAVQQRLQCQCVGHLPHADPADPLKRRAYTLVPDEHHGCHRLACQTNSIRAAGELA